MQTMTNHLLERIRAALDGGRLTVNALDDGSGVLLDLDGEQLLTLNHSAMHLIQTLQSGGCDLEALTLALTERFAVDADPARADAEVFIEQLSAALD